MKVLFDAIMGVGIVPAVEKWVDKYGLNAIYSIEMEAATSNIEASPLNDFLKEKFAFLDMVEARYEKYVFYNKLPPLDEDILVKMAPYEPEALKMLERDGRIEDSAEKRFIQYHKHVRYWNYFLDKAEIDLVCFSMVPHSIYNYIILRLCQIKGIPTLLRGVVPFQSSARLIPFWDYEKFDAKIAEKINQYAAMYQTEAEVELGEIAQKEYDLFREVKKQVVPVIDSLPNISDYWHTFRTYFSRSKKDTLLRAMKHIKSRHEINRLLGYYDRLAEEPDLSVPYIYFPLHYQPEMTTCPMGGWFVHQYLAIQMLSFYAPPEVWIYIKEHPAMKDVYTNARIAAHYNQIVRLKNVKLIPLKMDTVQLTKRAVAVASITGSVGYEAMFQHKPYIMFGNHIMRYGPGTLNVRNNEDCKIAMSRIFDEGMAYDDRDVKIFLKVVEELSVDNTMSDGHRLSEEALADLASRWDIMLRECFGNGDLRKMRNITGGENNS